MAGTSDGAAEAALLALARILAPLVAREVVRELRAAEQPGFVDQSKTTIGRRRHIELARKLIAEGSSDAAQIGRRYLVRRERIEAHASALTQKKRPSAVVQQPEASDVFSTFTARFGLTKGAA